MNRETWCLGEESISSKARLSMACCAQAAVRGHQQRMAYMHTLAAVLTIQIALRRWQLNRRVSARATERRGRETCAAAAAAAEAEKAATERAAVEEKQRQERANFAAIKASPLHSQSCGAQSRSSVVPGGLC